MSNPDRSATANVETLFEGRVVVIDDAVSPPVHEALWKFFVGQKFYSCHEPHFAPTYRLTDGQSWASNTSTIRIFKTPRSGAPTSVGAPSNPIGQMLSAMLSTPEVQALLLQSQAWSDLALNCTIFPPGAGLSWHADGGHSAAFAYYVHPRWNEAWGGELLLDRARPDPETETGGASSRKPSHRDLYQDISRAYEETMGLGHYVTARPNRLVVLQAGVRHAIKKVDLAAGEAYRAAISGFFTIAGQ